MSYFLYNEDNEEPDTVDIDELYEKQHRRDMKQLNIYNKLLNRINKRIKHISRVKKSETHIFYNVPEYIFGESVYDNKDCTGYLVAKLEENGFLVKYIHPNTLFISWNNWVPSYVRDEIRKKTGINLDNTGNIIEKKGNKEEIVDEDDINAGLFNDTNNVLEKPKKQYNDISEYKPTGRLVYNPEILQKIEKKVAFNPDNN
jgi:hypothetical protein